MLVAEVVFIGFSALSAACSASIVLTGLVFPSIMLSPQHPFSNILFIIALADMIACIGLSFGYPREGSNLCTTQAFLAMMFLPATWLWSSALVYQMHCMIVYKQLFLNMTHLHVICWTIAALVALLPLTRNPYGQDDDLNETTICWLHCREHDCYLWNLGLYIPTLIINIALMSHYLHKIHTYLKRQMGDDRVGRERVLFRSLYWYPIGLIMCWTFTIIAELLIAVQLGHRKTLMHIAAIITSQYGTICCLVFFSNSSSVRNHWWTLLNYNYRQNTISQTDQSSRLSFLGDSMDIEIAVPPPFNITDSIDRHHHHHNNSRDDANDGNIECRTISRSSTGISIDGPSSSSSSIEQLRDRNISMEPGALYAIHGDTRNILFSSSSSSSRADNKQEEGH